MELLWRSADGHEHRFAPAADRVLVGRAPDCDLILHDPEVSAHHLVLAVTEGGWEARDLGSTNGTRLDGDAVVDGAIVGDGQCLEVGDTRLEVADVAPPPPPSEPFGEFPPTPTRPERPVGDPRAPGSVLARLRRGRRADA